jgi:hypothetical protein
MGRLSYLKALRDLVYTKLCLVKDIELGEYFVKKCLIVTNRDIVKNCYNGSIHSVAPIIDALNWR